MKKGWEGRERGGKEKGKEQWREGGRGKKKNFRFILSNFFLFQKENSRASKTVQQVKALAAKPYYANSIPSSHMVDRESTLLLAALQPPHYMLFPFGKHQS